MTTEPSGWPGLHADSRLLGCNKIQLLDVINIHATFI